MAIPTYSASPQRSKNALVLITSLAARVALADPYKPNEAGVSMGHWHLNSRDVLQEAVAELKGSNVITATGANGINGRLDPAFVTTADGLKLEFLEDKNQKIPIRSHNVHFYVPESVIPDMQAWYGKFFGAKPGMCGRYQAADVPGANLIFTKSDIPTVATKGHVLDHIGFDVLDIHAALKKFDAAGIKPVAPVVKNATTGVWITFIQDPWGTYIELNQRPNQTYLDQM